MKNSPPPDNTNERLPFSNRVQCWLGLRVLLDGIGIPRTKKGPEQGSGEAATANASATRKATLAVGPRTIAIAMAIAPTTKAATRATRRSSPGKRSTPA